jgi:replication initiation protein RepC
MLETFVSQQNMNGSESHNERHIQNQTTYAFELDPSLREGGAASFETKSATVDAVASEAPPSGAGPRPYPLGMVLSACPDIVEFAREGVGHWRDLRDAAEVARSALGVSPDAWAQAREAMGAEDAAVAIAAILQRGEEITSAGGYLRALTAKAREGTFSLGPLLMALLRRKSGEKRRA